MGSRSQENGQRQEETGGKASGAPGPGLNVISWVWADGWANFLIPSFWTILAIIVSHMLHRKAMATKMDKLRRETAEMEKRLHARIRRMTGRTEDAHETEGIDDQ